MGYDTYNAFNCNYTGALATEQARAMHEYGLVEAGYNVRIVCSVYGYGLTNYRPLFLMIATLKSTDLQKAN